MTLVFTRRLKAALVAGILALVSLMVWSGVKDHDTTLEIRASRQGESVPDGFYIWHNLDANGIRFKSITPHDNSLLVTFGSSAQSEAAIQVLNRTLPGGYVVAQQDGGRSTPARLPHPEHNHLG